MVLPRWLKRAGAFWPSMALMLADRDGQFRAEHFVDGVAGGRLGVRFAAGRSGFGPDRQQPCYLLGAEP